MGDGIEHRLLVAFPDESFSFTNGFEAGMIWERLTAGEYRVGPRTVHAENKEVFQNMARAAGYDLEIVPTLIEGWCEAVFTKAPKGFAVIEGGAT